MSAAVDSARGLAAGNIARAGLLRVMAMGRMLMLRLEAWYMDACS